MAITITKQPDSKFNPAYNPIVYEIDSTNKNKDGFRYLVQVKSTVSGSPLLFEKSIIPDVNTKKGNVHLNRELSDYVSFRFDSGIINGVGGAGGTNFQHKIEFGEEYFEEWEWADYGFVPNSEVSTYEYNPDNLINATMLFITVSQGQEPPYSIGDKIFVNLNTGTQERPQLAGVHEVLKVEQTSILGIQSYKVVLSIPWVGSGTSTGGSSRYADNRKTKFLAENVELGITSVWNGVFEHNKFNSYNTDDFVLDGVTKLPLSQVYDGYKIRENSRMYMNFYNEPNVPTKVRFRNDSGEVYDREFGFSATNIRTINVGTSRTDFGTLISGSGDFIKPTTETYSFQFYKDAVPTSKEITLQIDRSCPIDEAIELQFLDKLGGFLPFYFKLMNVESHNISRDKSVKFNGNFGADKWVNDLEEGGEEIYNSGFETNYLLRTDFLNDKDAKFFHNVVESPVTFIILNGQPLRCVIETTTVEVKKEKWYELKRYEITLTLSNRNKINI